MSHDKKTISALKKLLHEVDLQALLDFLHATKASWGVTRPATMNDRKQSSAYRARIQVPNHFEHAASGDTARSAIANALASFLTHEQGDYHTLLPESRSQL